MNGTADTQLHFTAGEVTHKSVFRIAKRTGQPVEFVTTRASPAGTRLEGLLDRLIARWVAGTSDLPLLTADIG
jgi:hypothetical protein